MQVNFGGVESLSTVDYPEHPCMTIFLRGCGLRCPWCHNKELQCGETFVDTEVIYSLMCEAMDFIEAVVFSGGEPLDQIEAVREMAFDAHTLGLLVGIHTAQPDKLKELPELVDYAWIADPHIHPAQPGSHRAIWYDHGGETISSRGKN